MPHNIQKALGLNGPMERLMTFKKLDPFRKLSINSNRIFLYFNWWNNHYLFHFVNLINMWGLYQQLVFSYQLQQNLFYKWMTTTLCPPPFNFQTYFFIQKLQKLDQLTFMQFRLFFPVSLDYTFHSNSFNSHTPEEAIQNSQMNWI